MERSFLHLVEQVGDWFERDEDEPTDWDAIIRADGPEPEPDLSDVDWDTVLY